MDPEFEELLRGLLDFIWTGESFRGLDNDELGVEAAIEEILGSLWLADSPYRGRVNFFRVTPGFWEPLERVLALFPEGSVWIEDEKITLREELHESVMAWLEREYAPSVWIPPGPR